MVNFQPLNDRVLIKQDKTVEMTPGGVHLPTMSQAPPPHGIVVAKGTGAITLEGERVPIDVEVGDRVIFKRNAGFAVDIEGEEYLIVVQSDVVGKYTSPPLNEVVAEILKA